MSISGSVSVCNHGAGADAFLHTWPELPLGTCEKGKEVREPRVQAASASRVDIVSGFTIFRSSFAFQAVNDSGDAFTCDSDKLHSSLVMLLRSNGPLHYCMQ